MRSVSLRSEALSMCGVALFTAALGVSAARAEDEGLQWYLNVYLQQSFPKQTETNRQIEQINQTFGTAFDTWDDIANLSIGGQLFRRVHERLKVGVEMDYSRGGLEGSATLPTEVGDARLAFSQKYSTFLSVLAVAHFLPCPSCEKAQPFVLGGVGLGYEKDMTLLSLANPYFYEYLRVENSGSFPIGTLGGGVDIPLGTPRWYVEAGAAYYWGRLKHDVDAEGSLAPSPRVTADSESTGPNYWVGFGHRF